MEGDPCARRKIAIRSRGSNPGGCHGRRLSALRRHKTGYKWLDRYAQQGVAGLADQSKAPKRQAQAFPAEIEREILALRARYPTWGEDKLKARLERTNPDINWPAHSTIGALLKRHGLTHPGKRRRHATPSSKLTSAKATKFGRSISRVGSKPATANAIR